MPFCYGAKKWYPRKDSNLHWSVSKTVASAKLGYGGMVRRDGIEPPMFTLWVPGLQPGAFAARLHRLNDGIFTYQTSGLLGLAAGSITEQV